MNLAAAFDFTPEDLAANRAGTMTPRQVEKLEAHWQMMTRGSRVMMVFYLVGFPVLILISLVVQYYNEGKSLADFFGSSDVFIFLGIVGMLCFLLVFAAAVTRFQLRHMRLQRLNIAEGVAHPFIGTGYYRGGKYMRYELKLKGGKPRQKLFRFSDEKQAKAFRQGEVYRIYYVKMTPFDIILSAEKM